MVPNPLPVLFPLLLGAAPGSILGSEGVPKMCGSCKHTAGMCCPVGEGRVIILFFLCLIVF